IWEERSKNDDGLLMAHSPDGGATWESPHRVVKDDASARPMWPGIAAAAGRVTAVWTGGVTGTPTKGWLRPPAPARPGENREPADDDLRGTHAALLPHAQREEPCVSRVAWWRRERSRRDLSGRLRRRRRDLAPSIQLGAAHRSGRSGPRPGVAPASGSEWR